MVVQTVQHTRGEWGLEPGCTPVSCVPAAPLQCVVDVGWVSTSGRPGLHALSVATVNPNPRWTSSLSWQTWVCLVPEMWVLLKHLAQWGAQILHKGLKLTTIDTVKETGRAPRIEREGREVAWDNSTMRAFSRQREGTYRGPVRWQDLREQAAHIGHWGGSRRWGEEWGCEEPWVLG